MKECVMFSGGMDSLIASLMVGCKNLVYVSFGHKYQGSEKKSATAGAQRLGTVLQSFSGPYLHEFEEPSAYIPGRNLWLALSGAMVYDKIWIGLQAGEFSLPDRTPVFCKMASAMISMTLGRDVVIDSPLWDIHKHDMVKWFISQGYPKEWLLEARSCYSLHPYECGECKACLRKYMALEYNGIDSRRCFLMNPSVTPAAMEYRLNIGHYDKERQEVIRSTLHDHSG